MEETEKIDSKQLKGINDGYLLAVHEPELAEKLSKIEAVSPWLVGMQQGREQFLKEQVKDKLPSWLNDSRPIKESKQPDKGKGIEPSK